MAPTNPQLERAKQGDPEAIAALMRRSLEPKGINVQAESGGDVLRVVLEGSQPVNREALLAFIRKGMLQLGVKGLRSIAVEWRQPGSLLTDWTDSISLDDDDPYSLDAISMSQIEAPTTPPVDMDDLPMADGGYDTDRYDLDDSADDSMAAAAETSKPAKKGSSSGLLLLLGLVAIGGGLYYLYQKGDLNSVVANLPPEVQTYLPPVATSETAEPAITPEAPPAGSPAAAPSPTPAAPAPAAPSPSPAAAVPAAAPSAAPSPAAPAPSPAAVAPSPAAPAPAPAAPAPAAQPNPDFAEAVRKAMNAANLAQKAKTKAEWTTVAAEWQAASALMQKVPADNPNFATAQNRAPQYLQNAAIARTYAQAAP